MFSGSESAASYSPSSPLLNSEIVLSISSSSPVPCDARSPFSQAQLCDGEPDEPKSMDTSASADRDADLTYDPVSATCEQPIGQLMCLETSRFDDQYWSLCDDAGEELPAAVAVAVAAVASSVVHRQRVSANTDAYRRNAVRRYLEKRTCRISGANLKRRQRRLQNGKDILRYSSRQTIAQARPRVRGRFVSGPLKAVPA